MSLRVPTNHSVRRRRPIDLVWEEIRAIWIVPTMTGMVRRRLEEANELKLLQGLQGYATGRETELAELGRLLGQSRRVVMRGLGGVGKTQLVLADCGTVEVLRWRTTVGCSGPVGWPVG